ncbi:hypothetical protein LOAG_12441 [Loa loa]|uniref:Uncharacterized protein n=1 Tax=Loa loa TaxID=7209 RepID=A0A1S0TLN2_LOALO|nr:hypothetical protein LOAG_12441 [Loa loa]EFO16067.1 hypothetical protein LOAG_12441 [Loa loa]
MITCSSSHRSLPNVPLSNSTVSSISTETIPSHFTANNSTLCMTSRIDDDIVEIIPEFTKRSYTLDCSDVQRIRISCNIFDRKNDIPMDNRAVIGFQQRKMKEFPLQTDDEISEIPILGLKNPVVFLTPKVMHKKKSLSAG